MNWSGKGIFVYKVSNIKLIIDNNLCSGCGACAGVCPSKAISFDLNKHYLPEINYNKCNSCKVCLRVCPGNGYPVTQWSKINNITTDINEMGPVLGIFKGYSNDNQIRKSSASGGIATSLILFLLESKIIDEVVVIGMENERPVIKITNDSQTVLECMMSKYGPVPLLATLIPELNKKPRKFAMTCTPCQLAGWIKSTEIYPKLKGCLVLSIGLFCGQIQSYEALSSVASSMGVKYPGSAKFCAWRYGNYPGSMRFELKDGTPIEKPLYSWLDIAVPHFSLNRCFVCPDGGNWAADITLGDIHSGGTDETVVVCRTKNGMESIISANAADKITVIKMTPEQVNSCVAHKIIKSKLLPAISIIKWLKQKHKLAPVYDYGLLFNTKAKRSEYLWVLRYKIIMWVRSGWKREFLLKHPGLMEKLGHFLYYFPGTIPGLKILIKIRKQLIR